MARHSPVEGAHAEAVINASPEAVYSALSDVDRLPRWWAVWPECHVKAASGEARQGAPFRIDSETRRGVEHFISGTVLHAAPDLISLTWMTDESRDLASTVFISIEPKGDSTIVSVDHEGLTSVDETRRMKDAWTLILRVMQRGIPHLDETRAAPEVAAYLKRRARHHLRK